MSRLAWATDLHLEFCNDAQVEAFCAQLTASAPDALLISGDTGQAPTVLEYLRRLERSVSCPVYFVLGNHDFYRGSIAGVRSRISQALATEDRLHWLPFAGIVTLGEETALVGVDGWADGRYGDFLASRIVLNDYRMIDELTDLNPAARLAVLNRLGDEEAAKLRQLLESALSARRRVIVLTHVPPFAEAAWHEGRTSDDAWLPHFACKATGDALLTAADAHPARELLVLCGHTHGAGEVQMRPNLRVITGGAEYGHPAVQRIIEAR